VFLTEYPALVTPDKYNVHVCIPSIYIRS